MFLEIMATLKAIQSIASSLEKANALRKEMMESHELKQIEDFKKGVRIELEKIESATTDSMRRALVVSLSKRLSE